MDSALVHSHRDQRSGFTLVELAVVVAILALLSAVVLPAIQAARAASRRADCSSRLHQIVLAADQIEESSGRYPDAGDFAVRIHAFVNGTKIELLEEWGQDSLELMVCPDGGDHYGNWGTKFRNGLGDGWAANPGRTRREFVDGSSQTAGYSERIRERILWFTARRVPLVPGRESELVDVCRSARTTDGSAIPWITMNGYDHHLEPNGPSCWNGPLPDGENDPFVFTFQFDGVFPATSWHVGGVNVAYLDGHVSFVSDSIDHRVWQAIGTINGRETVARP
jgi:prepilin-type N-terminal cleavage/methylation domain-containing protein/prepilin-type processing-associated H-X9-DG protein